MREKKNYRTIEEWNSIHFASDRNISWIHKIFADFKAVASFTLADDEWSLPFAPGRYQKLRSSNGCFKFESLKSLLWFEGGTCVKLLIKKTWWWRHNWRITTRSDWLRALRLWMLRKWPISSEQSKHTHHYSKESQKTRSALFHIPDSIVCSFRPSLWCAKENWPKYLSNKTGSARRT